MFYRAAPHPATRRALVYPDPCAINEFRPPVTWPLLTYVENLIDVILQIGASRQSRTTRQGEGFLIPAFRRLLFLSAFKLVHGISAGENLNGEFITSGLSVSKFDAFIYESRPRRPMALGDGVFK